MKNEKKTKQGKNSPGDLVAAIKGESQWWLNYER